ncbi:MAG: hypothetical protein V7784_02740 [Oceanospirillaceae bacterium]
MNEQLHSIDQRGLLSALIARCSNFFENDLPAGRLVNIVNGLGNEIGLSKKQHICLQQQAAELAKMLDDSSAKELDEPMLLSVLQGDIMAGEVLISDFDKAGNHQRPALLKTLNALGVWFMALNSNQQENIKCLQQRPFRLSIG